VRSQRVRRIGLGFVAWCMGCIVLMAGCSGDEDQTTDLSSSQPVQSVAPRDVTSNGTLTLGIENKSYRFTDGSVFNVKHFDTRTPVPSQVPLAVLLTIGAFGNDVSAPFVLVSSDGFRASGVITRVNFYTLDVQDSTFPPQTSSPQPNTTQGPQQGDSISLDLQSKDPQDPVGPGRILTAQQVPFTPATPVVSSDDSNAVCGHTTSTNTPLQTLGPLTRTGCITVNGSVNSAVLNMVVNAYVVTLPQDRQEDLVVNAILTHPQGTGANSPFSDFDLAIFAAGSDGSVTPGQQPLNACFSGRSPETCTVLIRRTDQVPALLIQVIGFSGTGAYTLEIRPTPITSACSNQTNGITARNSSIAQAQDVGVITSCLRINGSSITTLNDTDTYKFTTDNSFLTFILTLAFPRGDLDLAVFDAQAPTNPLLLVCFTAFNPEVCSSLDFFATPSQASNQARQLVVAVFPFLLSPVASQNTYTLDIIATRLQQPLDLPVRLSPTPIPVVSDDPRFIAPPRTR
jgi:hypothetical protein